MVNKDLKFILNKFLLGTYLSSYLVRMFIYLLLCFLFFSSFNNFYKVESGYLEAGFEAKEAYAYFFNIYMFKSFIGSYFVFIFFIEGLLVLIDVVSYKKQYLIYQVGRTNNYFKETFKIMLIRTTKSAFIIYFSFVLNCLLILVLCYLLGGGIYFMDSSLWMDVFTFPNAPDAWIAYGNLYPIYILFIVWIPALFCFIIINLLIFLFQERIKNIIFSIIFALIIYIVLTILIASFLDFRFLIPIYPIMNIQHMTSQVYSWASVLIEFIALLIILKIRKWRKWDEI